MSESTKIMVKDSIDEDFTETQREIIREIVRDELGRMFRKQFKRM